MKYFLLLIFCILFLEVFSYNTNKIDPVFLAEYAKSLGDPIPIRNREYKGFVNNLLEQKGEYGFIESRNVFKIIQDSLIEIIIQTDNPNYTDSIVNGVFLYNSFITGYASKQEILNFSEKNDIDYIYISKPLFQSNDKASFYSHIYDMHINEYYGNNIAACLIDDGFEVDHYIFENIPNRVKLIWNQKKERINTPINFNYGEIIDSSNYKYYSMFDTTGHGTAVLATLASGDSIFSGMMPFSPIIGVNVFPTQKSIMDGIAFIDSVCEYRSTPYVLCLPLNHYWGKHNGQGVLEKFINILFNDNEKGKAISVSAGNLGNKYIHFSAIIDSSKKEELLKNQYCVFNKKSEKRADIDIIFDNKLLIRFIIIFNGKLYVSQWNNIDIRRFGYFNYEDITLSYGVDGNKQLHITMNDNKIYKLIIEFASIDKANTVNGYAAQGGYFSHLLDDKYAINGDFENTIASPALAKQAIASGTFVSRNMYDNIDLTMDSIYQIPGWNSKGSQLSSKPDLYAPGKFIISYSLIYDNYSINPYYRLFYGSSFSSAVTAGALGVILGTNPYLSVKNLYSLIIEGLHFVPLYKDGIIIGEYGLLDAYASFLSTRVFIKESFFTIMQLNNSIEFRIIRDKFVFDNIKKLNGQSIKIVSNKKALDTMPDYGNNVYRIVIRNMKNNNLFSFTDTVLYNGFNNTIKIPKNYNIFYDIIGRKYIFYNGLKPGIYYKKTSLGVEKILKLK